MPFKLLPLSFYVLSLVNSFQAGEILGIWDIGHIALISSVFCSLVALPLQISIEVLFRNNMVKYIVPCLYYKAMTIAPVID